MNDLSIGTDDYRVLEYARLVDPEVWPGCGDPEVNAVTAPRLKFSIEAGYRIAVHEGGVTDPTDVVARLSTALGLSDLQNGLRRPVGVDEAELASMAAVLMDEPEDTGVGVAKHSEWREGEGFTRPLPWNLPDTGLADALASVRKPTFLAETTRIVEKIRQGSRPFVLDKGSDRIDLDEQDVDPDRDPDPDHDPEAGISHVGDDDEGQHHEEP